MPSQERTFSLAELAKVINYSVSGQEFGDIGIENISDDSRSDKPNTLFVAIEGTLSDGHGYLKELGSNFVAAVGEKDCDNLEIGYLRVENSRKALAQLAHYVKGNPANDIINIGVTGTNGKTTVSYILHHLLKGLSDKPALIGTTGIFIGESKHPATHTTPSPRALADLFEEFGKNGVRHSVMEVSSHALHQYRTYGIGFKAAIFTNLTQDHLDYHHSMEEYAKAKKMLFDGLDSDSIAVVWSDSDYSDYMVSDSDAIVIKVGSKQGENYSVISSKVTLEGTKIQLLSPQGLLMINSPLLGAFNVANLSLAIASLMEMGYDKDRILEGIEKFGGVPGRLEIVRGSEGVAQALTVVDYAHTPDALENALRTLGDIEGVGNLICVFGCGGDRDKTKRPIMGSIAEKHSDIVIITNDNPRTEDPETIAMEIAAGMDSKCKIILDRKEAIEHALKIAGELDIVLIAGKGHEDYQVIGTEKVHFSDQEVLRASLR